MEGKRKAKGAGMEVRHRVGGEVESAAQTGRIECQVSARRQKKKGEIGLPP